MSWFLFHREGLSLMDGDYETRFDGKSPRLDLTAMVKDARTLIMEPLHERPEKKPEAPVPTSPKKRSVNCDALVKKWEGYHRALKDGSCEAYPDPDPQGPVTIGWGTTRYDVVKRFGRPDVHLGDVLTRAEADAELTFEMDDCERGLATAIQVPVTQGMFDALVSFVYNLGMGGSQRQIERVNAGDYEGCANAFDLYVRGESGKALPGLIARRNEEEALFRSEGLDPRGALRPAPEPSVSEAKIVRLDARLAQEWEGLSALLLTIGDEEFIVASGARGAQNFRKPKDPASVPGNLEPIPQGRYSIADISWAGGKDNYDSSHGPGLGPVWIALTAQFEDDRGAFGIHLDANIGKSPGSAGCVVLPSVSELRRLVAALRTFDPKMLVADWGIA